MIGTIVGNYKIMQKLGEGGMGAVYKGLDLMLEREVAIKVLRPELLSRPDLVERFRAEAITLARLNHPNVATLYSFLRQGDEFFMVLEFVPGETLESLINSCGALSCEQAAYLISQALTGIAHAHQANVIHRDLKPANLMLTCDGSVKVMDFGIARALDGERMTRAGRLVGTIEYMSPEQVRGQTTDIRSDLYSLGIVLYELLTGSLPFKSDSEFELMRMQIEDVPQSSVLLAQNLPPAMEQIVLRALSKQPESRFQNASEFCQALLPLVENTQIVQASRNNHPLISPRSNESSLKETRLPGGTGNEAVPINPTRWLPVVEAEPQRNIRQAKSWQLRWKYYATAGIFFGALLSLTFALFSGKNEAPTAPQNSVTIAMPAPQPLPSQTPDVTTNIEPVLEALVTAPQVTLSSTVSMQPVATPTVAIRATANEKRQAAPAKKIVKESNSDVQAAAARERARRRAAAERALNQ